MKILIDIPKQDYIYIVKNHCLPSCDDRALRKAYYQMISSGVPLDEIRAEIESQREEVSKKHSETDEALTNYYFGLNDGLKDARDILDKYKAESEE